MIQESVTKFSQLDNQYFEAQFLVEQKQSIQKQQPHFWQDYDFFTPADGQNNELDKLGYSEGKLQQRDPNHFELLLAKPPSMEALWDFKLQDFCKKQQNDFFYPQDGYTGYTEDEQSQLKPEGISFDQPLALFPASAQTQETQIEPASVKRSNRSIKKLKNQAFHSLAHRNMRLNMGTAMTHYINFLIQRAQIATNHKLVNKYQALLKWLNQNQSYFRSFEGWQALWKDHPQGHLFRKISFRFFSDSFAESYIANGKVKANYKSEYMKKITKFKSGSVRPSAFTSKFFKAEQQEQQHQQGKLSGLFN